MRKVTEDFIGTCQACFGEFKVSDQFKVIVLHGYQRPGNGYIIGDCDGHGHAPFEYDCEFTGEVIERHRVRILQLQTYLSRLNIGDVTELTREWREYNEDTRRRENLSEKISPDSKHWEGCLNTKVAQTEARIAHHTRVAAFLQNKVDNWTRLPIIGLDSPATGKERYLRKAYDPIEEDAKKVREAEKTARDAKPGKLRIHFYKPEHWEGGPASTNEQFQDRYSQLLARRKAYVETVKTWAKTTFEGKLIVREGSDYDLPRSIRPPAGGLDVVTVFVPWEYRDQIATLLPNAERSLDEKKKVDYTCAGEPSDA